MCSTKGHTTPPLPAEPVFAHHGGRGLPAHEEPTNSSSLQVARKTKPSLLRQAPPFPLGAAMEVPSPRSRRRSQAALLSDKADLRPHQKESSLPPTQGRKQKHGSSLHLTPPHCCPSACQGHSYLTAISPNTCLQRLLVGRPKSQGWEWGCNLQMIQKSWESFLETSTFYAQGSKPEAGDTQKDIVIQDPALKESVI